MQDVAKAIQTKPFDRSHESLRPRHRGGGKGGKGGAGGAAWRGCAATAFDSTDSPGTAVQCSACRELDGKVPPQ